LTLLSAVAAWAAIVTRQPSSGIASYTRFSSSNQDEKSISDQQRDCRARAARDGFEMTPSLDFSDEAVSGAKHSREGFDEMLAAARAGRIRVLYLVNLSRLARDLILTLQVLRELVYGCKVRVVCIDEGLDTDQNENWQLLAAIFGVQNQQYLKTLAQNVFRGQTGVILDMLSVGDYCFGFMGEAIPGTEKQRKGRLKVPKKKYVIDWDKAEWVIRIFNWFVIDKKPLRWIARELNRHQAPKDHRATTPQWYHQILLGLLSNRKYVGLWPWGEKKNVRDQMTGQMRQEKRPIAEAEQWLRHFPDLAVIDHEIFAKAQKRLRENAVAHGKHRRANGQLTGSSRESHDAHPRHPLSGLIKCGHCGRRFNVGGTKGKYLFCPGYPRGTCPCQTTLQRALAESLILNTIGDRVLSNPTWVEHLLALTLRSHQKLLSERPNRKQVVAEKLAEVEGAIQNLIANCEKGVVPELEVRLSELRVDRDTYRAEQQQLIADEESMKGPPTRAWIEEGLSNLRSILSAQGPAAAHALRALVGGSIVVTEVHRPGKKRHYLTGRMELRLVSIGDAVGVQLAASDLDCRMSEIIALDFRLPERHEQIADEAKRLWDDGLTEKEIAVKINCGRAMVSRALDDWYEKRNLVRPDGRSLRKRLKNRRKAELLQPRIMELWDQDLSVNEIAERVDCCLEIVHEAVKNWHKDRDLPVPDGRARRRQIRLRRREAG
jgi:DNA invertase Pin-like site-specific DNA recombinase